MNRNMLEEETPGRWQMLVRLAATLVLSMTTWFSASAVIPQLREEWDLSANAAAWLTIAVQLGFVCGALVSSFLNVSDIVSPKHVILGGTIGAAAANGLVELAGAGDIGIALRFATGFFLAGVSIEGQLTLLGVTKPLKLTVSAFKCAPHPFTKKEMCGADATAQFKRTDYGMKTFVGPVSDDVKLVLNVEAYKE